MRLAGKVAIVSGGGSGIGRGVAVLLAENGARVMLAGRREDRLRETAELIRAAGGEARWRPTDVSRAADAKALADETARQFGGIDVLCNNAAVFTGIGKTVEQLEEREWDELMSVNLKGVFLMCKQAIPHLRARGGGAIVNCSSISGHIGQRNQGAYNAAKGGIEMLSKCMALDFAPDHIRVNCVCPAWVEIDFNRGALEKNGDRIIGMHPIGRIGQPRDVAGAVLFLCSEDAAWITGTSLMVDGGYTAQ